MIFQMCHVFLEKKMSHYFFPTVISSGNVFSTVITSGNTFPPLITVGSTFLLVITVKNTFPLLIPVGKNNGLSFFLKKRRTLKCHLWATLKMPSETFSFQKFVGKIL